MLIPPGSTTNIESTMMCIVGISWCIMGNTFSSDTQLHVGIQMQFFCKMMDMWTVNNKFKVSVQFLVEIKHCKQVQDT